MISPLALLSFVLALSVEARTISQRTPELSQHKAGYETKVHNQTLKPEYPQFGSKKERVYYGPYTVPPMNSSMNAGAGMLSFAGSGFYMPCTDCTYLTATFGLVYPDNTYANANTSMWLHHMALDNSAEGDTVCGGRFSIYGGNRWIASGNERTPIDFTLGGRVPAGYYLEPNANQFYALELMNAAMYEQSVYMWVEWEYVPGNSSKLHHITPAWLDIGGCYASSEVLPVGGMAHTYNLPSNWTSKISGALVSSWAHLHDGGVGMEVFRNGQKLCANNVKYGGPGYADGPNTMEIKPTYPPPSGIFGFITGLPLVTGIPFYDGLRGSAGSILSTPVNTIGSIFKRITKRSEKPKVAMSMPMPMPNPNSMMTHISSISQCVAPSLGMVQKGDVFDVAARYNYTQHMGMLNPDGTESAIMGIALLYMLTDVNEAQMQAYLKGH